METKEVYKQTAIRYDSNFVPDKEYLDSMPDLQNFAKPNGHVYLPRVGIHNFKLPLMFAQRDKNEHITLHCQVSGFVDLAAHDKGINMSRIVRSFYEYKDADFSIKLLDHILREYKTALGSLHACLMIKFEYPMMQPSLRSGLEGYQYYPVTLKATINHDDQIRHEIIFDYTYSSACPCSFELSEHSYQTRGQKGISHSQRSVARIYTRLHVEEFMWIEDIKEACDRALRTETQVMVKRQDEQAFAELNAAYQKFVEDAVRDLYIEFAQIKKLEAFRIVCSHQESLHSHDAIAVVSHDPQCFYQDDITHEELSSLIHKS